MGTNSKTKGQRSIPYFEQLELCWDLSGFGTMYESTTIKLKNDTF